MRKVEKMTETLRTILERSSIRNFESTPLTEEQLRLLEDAALAAPTGMNLQELRFAFVTDRGLIDEVNQTVFRMMEEEGEAAGIQRMKDRGASDIYYGAPLVVFISAKESKWDALDAGIAVQNLALAAQSLGLGSCINGMCARAFRHGHPLSMERKIGMAEDETFYIAIAIGHKAVEKEPHSVDRSHLRRF